MKKFVLVFITLCLMSFYVSGQIDTETYKKNARQLIKQGKSAEAVEEISKAIAIAPNSTNLYIERANAYLDLGKTDAMKQDLFRAVNLDPDDEGTVFSASRTLFNAHIHGREFCGSAVSMLDRFLADHPKADRIFNFRGIVKQCAGDFVGAYEDFLKASELKPNEFIYQQALANALANLGDSPQALEFLAKLIADNENRLAAEKDSFKKSQLQFALSRFYSSRSYIYEKQGNVGAMYADLNKMVEIMPHPSSYLMRAKTYIRHKKYSEAINDYNEFLKLQPKNSSVYIDRGDMYFRLGKFSEALIDYEKALTLNDSERIKQTIERRIEQVKQKMQGNANQPK